MPKLRPLVKVEIAYIDDINPNRLTVICVNGHVLDRPRKWRRNSGGYWAKGVGERPRWIPAPSEEDPPPQHIRCEGCAEAKSKRYPWGMENPP